MQVGCKHGVLALTGEWIVDKFQNRLYEVSCECGEVLNMDSKTIRKRKCCSAHKHIEFKKPNNRKKNGLQKLKDKYIGETIRGCTVIDVIQGKNSRTFELRCNECGYVFNRKVNKFINGKTGGCIKIHPDEVKKREREAEILRAQKEEEAKERLKERKRKNKGMYRYKDLTGQRFGRFLVIGFAGYHETKSGTRSAKFLCQCDCGEQFVATGSVLKVRKYCDKELEQFKIEQGKRSAAKRRAKSEKPRTDRFRYLNGRKISKFSQAVYDKYNGVCQRCKEQFPKSMTASHHIIPINYKEKLAFFPSNGILLCKECHDGFHKKYGNTGFKYDDIFKYIKYDDRDDQQLDIIFWH